MKLSDIQQTFLINLDRRADRLTTANNKLVEAHFPLPVTRVRAIDGKLVNTPRWFKSGEGAWGCSRSHCLILEDAQMDQLNCILVLEDDFYFVKPETFVSDVEQFLSIVPEDWDMIMLGGQHMTPTTPVKEGVVRSVNTQRTHAYIVRDKAIGWLYELYSNSPNHIDWSHPQFMAQRKVYCPDPFLIGQDEGKSDVNGADNPRKLWRQPKANPPVYWFKNTPRETIEEVRKRGFHFGRNRDAKGQDVGLEPCFRERNVRMKPTRLRNWLGVIDWESASVENTGTSIWHTEPDEELIKQVCGERLVILENPTVEQAVAALQQHGGSA